MTEPAPPVPVFVNHLYNDPPPAQPFSLTQLVAESRKTIAVLVGEFVTYTQVYGLTWHLVPAVTAIAVALGVYGVPNATRTRP